MLRDRRPDEVLIAAPSASGDFRRRVVEAARVESIPVKTLPSLHELITGDVDLAQIRPVQVEDLLGREQVEVDLAEVAAYLRNKTVLVSGAGGSIGSELCRQIARVGPARLVLVDYAETALFEIERELVEEREFPASVPVLADCGNRAKLRQVFERYRPEVVFHAAAYKHVPLMEANPIESVRNNVLATRSVADTAVEFGASASCSSRPTRRRTRRRSWASRRRSASGSSRRTATASTCRPGSSPCASATCSARPARSCRFSGASSSAAGRSRSRTRR